MQVHSLPYQGPYSSFSPQISSWSTYSWDIIVYRPPFTPSPLHTTPPTQTSYLAFRLCFRVGNISVCNSCRGRFDKHAESPQTLCVQHEEWRLYTSAVTGLPESRFGNAHYAHPHCIVVKWSNFHPTDLQIPDEFKSSNHFAQRTPVQSIWSIVQFSSNYARGSNSSPVMHVSCTVSTAHPIYSYRYVFSHALTAHAEFHRKCIRNTVRILHINASAHSVDVMDAHIAYSN